MLPASYVIRVHEERAAIEQALGPEAGVLLAPAVTWLSLYVLQRERLAA
jgi:hypothetical protein